MLAVQQPNCSRITVTVHDEVASYLNNKKRRELHRLEDEGQLILQVLGREELHPEHLELDCRSATGDAIPLKI